MKMLIRSEAEMFSADWRIAHDVGRITTLLFILVDYTIISKEMLVSKLDYSITLAKTIQMWIFQL